MDQRQDDDQFNYGNESQSFDHYSDGDDPYFQRDNNNFEQYSARSRQSYRSRGYDNRDQGFT